MHKEKVICIFLYLFSLTVYLFTIIPTAYWGDSSEFCTTSYLLDIPHPPSYPVYNILGKLFSFIPTGEIAFRVNFLSTFFSSLTIILIFLIALHIPLYLQETLKTIIGLFSSLVFAFSLTFWRYSCKAEVYTLYIFFFALIILLLFLFDKKNDIRYFYLAGFTFLISLTNHLLIILSLTSFLFFILTFNYKVFINKKNLFILSLFSLMAFSIYLYLPLRSANKLKINWARTQTIDGFSYSILLKEQGKLHQDYTPPKEIKKEEIKKIKKITKEAFLPDLTFQLFELFIVFLPLYFSYLLMHKREYFLSFRKKVVIFILLFAAFLLSVTSYFFKLPKDLQKFLLYDVGLSRIEEIGFTYLINPLIDFISFMGILSFVYLSFTSKGRKIIKNISLLLLTGITIFIYTYLLTLSKGYKMHEFSSFIHLNILINQFGIYLFPLGIVGILKLYFENLRIFAFLFFLFVASGPLPILIILPDNIPLAQERFSLPAYLIFSIFIGYGAKVIIDILHKYTKLNYKYFSFVLVFSLIPLFLNFPQANKSKYYFTKNYAEDILLTLPKNSIILAKSIDTVFPLWYISYVEKKRNDVTIVYIDALTQKWYVDNLRETTILSIDNLEKKINSEGQRRTLYIKNIIKNNIDKYPIYYGGAPLFIPEGIIEGTAIPHGILFKIVKKPRDITEEEIEKNKKLLNSYKFTKSLKGIDYFAKDVLSIYAGGYYKLAMNLLSQGEYNNTLKYLNKSIKIDKKFIPSYLFLSQIYLQMNNVNTSEEILKNGIKNNPTNIDLIFQLAHIYFIKKSTSKCIKLLDKIIKLKKDFIPAYFAKVDVYLDLNEKEKAKEVLNEILKIDEDNRTAKDILKQLN